MSNATLTMTATLTNGGNTRSAELQVLESALRQAIGDVRSNGGKKTSNTISVGEYASVVSVTYTYTPVAST